jgi:hypothetical protein
VPFTWRDGKSYALNLFNNVLYTTTAQGCAAIRIKCWAMDLNNVELVKTFNPGSGGLWGRTGAAISSTAPCMRPPATAPTTREPGVRQRLIGVRLEGDKLPLKDYFIRRTGRGCGSATST